MDLADKTAGGRIVSVLEGGYDLQGLKESVSAHVTALMGA
jgi:acetoin utilization deacetylase AcuC-like enzyme